MKKFKKANLILMLFMVMSLILVGCSSKQKEEANSDVQAEATLDNSKEDKDTETETSQNEDDFGNREAILIEDRLLEDREGNNILIPDTAERIISMAPSITETLVNLGLADNIIGLDFYSLDVDGVSQDLPAFDIMTPDIESMLVLQPDIVFASGMSNEDGSNPFVPLVGGGAFITSIPTPTSIDGMIDDILFIGGITDTLDEAQKIVQDFQTEIEIIQSKVDDYLSSNPTQEGLSVYFETSPAPYMYSFGTQVFLNEYLEILGLKNIFDDQDGWLSISEEQVIERNPDIIFTNATYEETPDENIKNRDGWASISAVENDRVFIIDANRSARPNELSIEALEAMYEYIYQ